MSGLGPWALLALVAALLITDRPLVSSYGNNVGINDLGLHGLHDAGLHDEGLHLAPRPFGGAKDSPSRLLGNGLWRDRNAGDPFLDEMNLLEPGGGGSRPGGRGGLGSFGGANYPDSFSPNRFPSPFDSGRGPDPFSELLGRGSPRTRGLGPDFLGSGFSGSRFSDFGLPDPGSPGSAQRALDFPDLLDPSLLRLSGPGMPGTIPGLPPGSPGPGFPFGLSGFPPDVSSLFRFGGGLRFGPPLPFSLFQGLGGLPGPDVVQESAQVVGGPALNLGPQTSETRHSIRLEISQAPRPEPRDDPEPRPPLMRSPQPVRVRPVPAPHPPPPPPPPKPPQRFAPAIPGPFPFYPGFSRGPFLGPVQPAPRRGGITILRVGGGSKGSKGRGGSDLMVIEGDGNARTIITHEGRGKKTKKRNGGGNVVVLEGGNAGGQGTLLNQGGQGTNVINLGASTGGTSAVMDLSAANSGTLNAGNLMDLSAANSGTLNAGNLMDLSSANSGTLNAGNLMDFSGDNSGTFDAVGSGETGGNVGDN